VYNVLAQSENEILQMEISIANVQQESFREVLDEIEQKANVSFSYNNSVINPDSIISILVFNGKLEDMLKKILPANTSFIISSENIILYKAQESKHNRPIKKVVRTDVTNKRLQSLVTETEKFVIEKSRMASVLKIKPYVLTDVKIWPQETNENDTLASVHLAPILLNASPEKLASKNALNNPNKLSIRRNTSTPKRRKPNGKGKINYAVGPFFQFLNESIQYNNFGTSGDNAQIVEIISSSEEKARSKRAGIMASVTFDHFRLTSGFALQKSTECYNYVGKLDTTTAHFISVPDTSGFSLRGTNTYNYLSIPLFVGYKGNITRKMSCIGQVGIWAKLLNSHKGYFINLNTKLPYRFKKFEDAPIKKLQTDIAANISLEYLLFNQVSISSSFSYILPTSSFFNNEYPVTKLKSAWGYSFAIIRKF